ncbi:MAG: ribosome maturation factor RimM [Holosporaceae bacterium]|nr:ribosome maturation factor RimM [Holosporaceae bacterium]
MIKILRVVGAFGIHGFLRVFSFSEKLYSYKVVYDGNGNAYPFRIVRFIPKNMAIALIATITNRTEAERFKNCFFYIKDSDLVEKKENEFYISDLEGKEVQVINSEVRCKIVGVKNFGAGDLIEIIHGENTFFVPFTVENFPSSKNGILMTLEAFSGFKN